MIVLYLFISYIFILFYLKSVHYILILSNSFFIYSVCQDFPHSLVLIKSTHIGF